MNIEPATLPFARDAADALSRLGATLVGSGAIDQRTLERARRVASETGGRIDQVLTQLGLVSERGLAEAMAELIGVPLVAVADYPDAPLFLDRLKAKFLRRARAVETHASDVHLEPFADRLRVRYRYDGVLHEVEPPPARLQAAIISRIKIMARLDIAERRLPQDGRIKLTVRGHEIDFRVSSIPSLHGEKVVLRVLDRTAVEFDYEKLGLPADIRRGLERALELPNGMVLVTGPTGSGKTTTLYTGLLKLNAVARNVVTVDDSMGYG